MFQRHTIVFHIIRLSKKIQEVYGSKSFHNIFSYTQAATLLIIGSQKDVSQIEIARRLHIKPASVVSLIDELERLRLVKRITKVENRRRHQIILTPQGKLEAERIKGQTHKLESFLKSYLTQKETLGLFSSLEKLTEAVERLETETLTQNQVGKGVKNELPRAKQFVAP